MLNKGFVLTGIILMTIGCSKNTPELPEKAEVKEIMTLVCDYELKNTHLADNWQRFRLNSWVPSSFYPGLMAQYRVSEEERYLEMAKLWQKQMNIRLHLAFAMRMIICVGVRISICMKLKGKRICLRPQKTSLIPSSK